MKPAISVLVSTFERPSHLQRVLASVEAQRGVEEGMEVVVTDDGSRDETPKVVADFARSVSFPVKFTTHEHVGFHLSRCRNEGVAASSAPYLLFLDGDCLIPPDHLRKHLQMRRPGVVMGSYCIPLDRETSNEIDLKAVENGEFVNCGSRHARLSLLKLGIKSHFYNLIRHPTKPKLFGGNVGIFRKDYERVNGYDERFQGWGCEDDDLRLRLRKTGIRIKSILLKTCTFHLWHPPDPSRPRVWSEGDNVDLLKHGIRPTRCKYGLFGT